MGLESIFSYVNVKDYILLHTHDEHVVFFYQSPTVFRVTAVERALNSAFLGTFAK
jgi:hypothetical protein